MADYWQKSKRLAETNLYMLDYGILADVTFLVGEDRHEVKAHKYMLVSRSPVFYAMFCGTIAESRGTIELPDVVLDGFKELLRFLYSEDCIITADVVMSLLYAAKKYDVDGLVDRCRTYLKNEIVAENVCVILQQAHMFDEQDLVQQCLSFVFKNGDQVLQSAGFVSLGKEVLQMIIESDLLKAGEEKVYTACVKWAEEECKRRDKDVNDANSREALGELIYLIRFPIMPVAEFTSLVSDVGLLTSDEKVNIYQHFTSKDRERVYLFNKTAREGNRKLLSINRFKETVLDGWANHRCRPAIEFECSKDVSLIGVSMFTPLGHGEANGTLEVLDSSDQTLISIDIQLIYDESNRCVDKLFDPPVQLHKNTRYTLRQTLLGARLVYGMNGQECLTVEGLEVRFFKSNTDRSGNNVSNGQFHGLIVQV